MRRAADRLPVVRRPRVVLGLLLAFHILPVVTRPALIGGDEPHYVLAAMSMAVDGDLLLEPDYGLVADGSSRAGAKFAGKELEHHQRPVNGELVFSHPLGLPALLVPALWIQHLVAPGSAPDAVALVMTLLVTLLGVLAGRDLLYGLVGDRGAADLLTFCLYFATPLWFYSRTLFTEPYLWSLTVVSLWLMQRRRWWWAALVLGLTFLIKEMAILMIMPILLVVWRRYGGFLACRVAAGPTLAVVVFVVKNLVLHQTPLVTFQPFRYGSIVDGGIGLLIDASHGLLVFAPVLVLLLWLRRNEVAFPGVDSAMVFVLWFGVAASWVDWRGGSCFGPRLLIPVVPALGVLVALAWRGHHRHRPFAWCLAGAAVAGFVIEWCAVVTPFPAFWSISVVDLLVRDPLMTGIGCVLGVLAVRSLSATVGEPQAFAR